MDIFFFYLKTTMLHKKILLLLCAILLFDTSAAGKEKNVVYSVKSKNTVSVEGDIPVGSSATYVQTYNKKFQILKSGSSTLTLTGFDGITIIGITLSMKSNADAGSGSLSVTCGSFTLASIPDSKFNSRDWCGEYPEYYTDINPEVTPYRVGSGETISIVIKASENSLYCKSFSVTYSEELSAVGIPAVSLASGDYIGGQTVRLSLPEDNSASSIRYTTDGTDPSTDDGNFTVVTANTDIHITSPATVKAVATNDAGDRSAIVSRKYNVIVPDKTTQAALAGEYASTTYAMSSDNLQAVAVNAVNGKIVNADKDLEAILYWNIHEIGDSAVIGNGFGQFLNGGNTTAMTLSKWIFKWAVDRENGSWQYSSRTFLYGKTSDGAFHNYASDNISKSGYQADWTKPYSFSDGYVRSGLTSGQLATVCLPCDVAADDFKGARVFEIVGVRKATANMTVNDITSIVIRPVATISAGTPYLMITADTSFVAAYSGEPICEASTATGLVGNLSGAKITVKPSDATHWNYVVYKNQIVKVTDKVSATISDARAYLNLYSVPIFTGNDETAQTISISSDTTDTKEMSATEKAADTYTLNGQKVPPTHSLKGIYIKNGRKYSSK